MILHLELGLILHLELGIDFASWTWDGEAVGLDVGATFPPSLDVIVGDNVGVIVRYLLGFWEGVFVGFNVASDGLYVGLYDGDFDGCNVWSVGFLVGVCVGIFEGDNVGGFDGFIDGVIDGLFAGCDVEIVGVNVG